MRSGLPLRVRDSIDWGPPEFKFLAGTFYFVDREGRLWHVYDRGRLNGKLTTRMLGNGGASHRVFVAESGERQRYVFGRGERQDLKPSLVQRQLETAEPLGSR